MARFKERKLRCNIRKFLNQPGHHANASIVAYVERTKKNDGQHPYTYLHISDCDNTCTLEFGSYDADSRNNSLFKATTLVETLTRFRDALEVEYAQLGQDDEDDDIW